jgi:hypothetical protein
MGYNKLAKRDFENYAGAGMTKYFTEWFWLSGGAVAYTLEDVTEPMLSVMSKVKHDGEVVDAKLVGNYRIGTYGNYIQTGSAEISVGIKGTKAWHVLLRVTGEGRNNTIPEWTQAVMIGVRL